MLIGTSIILSHYYNTPLKKNWGSNIVELNKFPYKPSSLKELSTTLSLSENFDELISDGKKLLVELSMVLKSPNDPIKMKKLVELSTILKSEMEIKNSTKKQDYVYWDYYNTKEYLNKILSALKRNDILTASYAAVELQVSVACFLEKVKKDIYYNKYHFESFYDMDSSYKEEGFPNLVKIISTRNFDKIKESVDKFDHLMVEFLNKHGIIIKQSNDLSTVEEFLKTRFF